MPVPLVDLVEKDVGPLFDLLDKSACSQGDGDDERS